MKPVLYQRKHLKVPVRGWVVCSKEDVEAYAKDPQIWATRALYADEDVAVLQSENANLYVVMEEAATRIDMLEQQLERMTAERNHLLVALTLADVEEEEEE